MVKIIKSVIYRIKFSLRSIAIYSFLFVKLIAGKERARVLKNFVYGVVESLSPKNTLKKDAERLRRIAGMKRPLKLHFGCGARVLKGWINIDVFLPIKSKSEYNDPPELRGAKDEFFQIDVNEGPLPIPDESVDAIFHEDFIEHISQRNAVLFLAETFRVLKKGGIHRINTPDLLSSMKLHSDFMKGYGGVFVYEWDKHSHINIFTKRYLEELAKMVGYTEVYFTVKNKSRSPLVPPEFRPDSDRANEEQIFCDLIK